MKENLLYHEDDVRSAFRQYFPSGTLVPLLPSDIHGYRIRRQLSMDSQEGSGWDEIYAVRHPDESTTYVVAEYGEVQTDRKPTVTQVGFLDVSRRGLIAGQSQMVFVGYPPNIEKIVGEIWWTDTRWFMRRKGLGIRRLEIMNAFARIYHNASLRSDGPTEAEIGVWQKLIKQGKAKPDGEGEYVFL